MILRKYYQGDSAAMLQSQQPAKPVFHSKAAGAGGSIIDILEVVESDFAKNLAEEEATEADALSSYDARTQEIKVSVATKSQDVKYKVQEFCIAKPESYEERKARREAEINGLKEALAI